MKMDCTKIGRVSYRRDRCGAAGRSRGQGMVEFALALPVVLILTLGIIEGGRLLFIYTSLTAAGREAARYGAGIGQLSASTITLYNDCDGIRDAARRIGVFAGIEEDDPRVKIFHDTGPDTTPTLYCSGHTDTISLAQGDRIVVQVDVGYSPVVPLLPIPSFNLHTQNTHTILQEAKVVATPQPTPIGGYPKCDTSPYRITVDSPQGKDVVVTLQTLSTSADVKNVLVIWDKTGNPVLNNLTSDTATLGDTLDPFPISPPTYTRVVDGQLTTGHPQVFKLFFSKSLKNNVIIQFSLDTPDGACLFGQ